MEKISVIGAGSWGTALATVLAGNGHDVTIWSISEDEIQLLQEKREHTEKLPGVILDENIHLTTNMEEALIEIYRKLMNLKYIINKTDLYNKIT